MNNQSSPQTDEQSLDQPVHMSAIIESSAIDLSGKQSDVDIEHIFSSPVNRRKLSSLDKRLFLGTFESSSSPSVPPSCNSDNLNFCSSSSNNVFADCEKQYTTEISKPGGPFNEMEIAMFSVKGETTKQCENFAMKEIDLQYNENPPETSSSVFAVTKSTAFEEESFEKSAFATDVTDSAHEINKNKSDDLLDQDCDRIDKKNCSNIMNIAMKRRYDDSDISLQESLKRRKIVSDDSEMDVTESVDLRNNSQAAVRMYDDSDSSETRSDKKELLSSVVECSVEVDGSSVLKDEDLKKPVDLSRSDVINSKMSTKEVDFGFNGVIDSGNSARSFEKRSKILPTSEDDVEEDSCESLDECEQAHKSLVSKTLTFNSPSAAKKYDDTLSACDDSESNEEIDDGDDSDNDETSSEPTSVSDEVLESLKKARAGLLRVETDEGDEDGTGTMRIAVSDIDALKSHFSDTVCDSRQKPETKKSRKQNMPKRIVREQTQESEIYDNPDEGISELSSREQSEKDFTHLKKTDGKTEKSRKRYTPKRIVYDPDQEMNDEYRPEGKKKERKERKKNSKTKLVNDKERRKSDVMEDISSPNQFSIENQFQVGSPEFDFSLFDPRGLTPLSRGLSPLSWPGGMLPMVPHQASGLSLLSDAAETLTPGTSDDSNNLLVMKRLREIRFHRYRKISIFEKKQIAAHAKVHGVSTAAAFFGVSKSAVSLWTRTDFKDDDEDDCRRKRNCMIGNDKFEALVNRVKRQKNRKFKGLTKDDKQEVVKYAKLVGVREMARCLDVALGTISGWMRQFPLQIPTQNSEDCHSEKSANSLHCPLDLSQDIENSALKEYPLSAEIKKEPDDEFSSMLTGNDEHGCEKTKSGCDVKTEIIGKDVKKEFELSRFAALNDGDKSELIDMSPSTDSAHSNQRDAGLTNTGCQSEPTECSEKSRVLDVRLKREGGSGQNDVPKGQQEGSSNSGHDSDTAVCEEQKMSNLGETLDIDKMIAESYVKPDIEKCCSNLRQQIVGTCLESDKFFETLFRRVAETRVEKYKTLKASEKLEVVRYAKRIGVRRIAKLLDLATGTLSGWITKFQHHLDLTMDLNSENDGDSFSTLDDTQTVAKDTEHDLLQNSSFSKDSPGSCQSSDVTLTSSMRLSSSSILDNEEKAEVTALKFLLKDQFPVLKKKIEMAKKLKFKNITHTDKLEIVKCAKLVGIRPTARVFNFPLGTLSGWITKYQQYLGYAFQDEMKPSYQQIVDISMPNDSESPMVDNYQAVMSQASQSAEASLMAQKYLSAAYQALNFMPVADSDYSQ